MKAWLRQKKHSKIRTFWAVPEEMSQFSLNRVEVRLRKNFLPKNLALKYDLDIA